MDVNQRMKNELIEIILNKNCIKGYNLSLLESIEIKLDDVVITISENDIKNYLKIKGE